MAMGIIVDVNHLQKGELEYLQIVVGNILRLSVSVENTIIAERKTIDESGQ